MQSISNPINSKPIIAGYFALPLGTEFVVIGDRAVALGELSGKRQGQFFYPYGAKSGLFIRTRVQNAREISREISLSKRERTTPASVAMDFSDWK